MPDIDRILPLARASRYSFPKDPSAILPRCFGNMLDPNAVPNDTDDGGMTPAVCVNRLGLVYVINDGPVQNPEPQIFWNGILQPNPNNAIANFSPSINLEGHGLVAILQFYLRDVLNGEISVRHGGSVDPSGNPITNPVRGLMAMLTEYGGWTGADFDQGPCQQTIRDMDALGYPFYWMFQEERSVRDWLLELLPHYHTDATETGRGQLSMILDRSLTSLPILPDYHIPANEIKDFGSPATAISAEKQMDDLANQITLHMRHNWVAGQPTLSFVGDYVQSQAAYHAAYPVEFSFRGMYTLAHATTWLNSFVTRHGFEPRVVRLTMHGLKGTPLIPPRLITVEWPPRGWVQRVLKVRKRTTSWSRREVTLECIDCQRELSETFDVPSTSPSQRREQISRVYQWIPGTVGDHGLIEDAPGPGRNEAANGDFELGEKRGWELTAGSGIQRWSIIDDPANAYQGRWYAQSIAPALTDYNMVTLRRRIDPGEWLLVTGWFRIHAAGADGQARVIGVFYDLQGAFLQLLLGNPIGPTETYTESLLFAPAPPGAYHYRPGIGILPVLTTGQWRADRIVANSGSRGELLTKRLNDLATPNLVVNGDFEAGDIAWTKDPGWVFDHTFPRSGTAHMTHVFETTPGQARYLTPATYIPVSPGQPFRVQAYWTSNFGNGEAHMGVFWLDGLGFVSGPPDNSAALLPPGGTYTYHAWNGTVPSQAIYALPYAQMFNHTEGVWTLDDFAVGFAL